MRVILLKKIKGKRWDVGTNLDVHKTYGRELIKKKQAAEIPEYYNGKFYLNGVESNEMVLLQKKSKDFPVTIAQYERYIEKEKQVLKTHSVKKDKK